MSLKRLLFFNLLLVLLVFGCSSDTSSVDAQTNEPAGETSVTLETEDQKTLYAMGLAMSQNLGAFQLNEDEFKYFLQGMRDGTFGEDPLVDLQVYGPKLQAFAQARMTQAADAEKAESAAFLEKAAAEEGAESKESGLIITELAAGDGESPGPTDQVTVHYHGTLRDGSVFDSSRDRGQPATFGLNQVIPCWTEGLQLMKVGGKAKLVCPSGIAYGDQGRPPQIPGGAALVFEVELISIGS